MDDHNWQVFWLTLNFTFPFGPWPEQWFEELILHPLAADGVLQLRG